MELIEVRNGEKLCKCNQCDSILYDENPQTGAKEYSTDGLYVDYMEQIEDEDGHFWACPKCMTDGYLTDL